MLDEVDRVLAEGPFRSLRRSEEIGDDGETGVFRILEQEGRTLGRDHASMDLGDLKAGVDFRFDFDNDGMPNSWEDENGFDKNDPAAEDRLNRLFAEAHLFVLPTRADCTPMVVAEANAWGTPVLITDTGGIASLMASEGGNGRMLAPEAGPEDWAGAIRALAADPAAYAALCRTSFDHARARLTWEAWARDLVAYLRGRA